MSMGYKNMKKFNILHFSLFIFITLFLISALDIYHDLHDMGGMNTHIWIEIVMAILSLVAFGYMLHSIRRHKIKLTDVSESLDQTKQQLDSAQEQSQKLRGEFSDMIQKQFQTWAFTNSEKEVALLLLKGLSLDEIANIRNTKEKTVRQQASNLYKKAQVAGRHELVAYFFEDLLITNTESSAT
ncbi:Helix-turn-helix transcriptional regulator [uncultured Thiomicrorhabdus sp.]